MTHLFLQTPTVCCCFHTPPSPPHAYPTCYIYTSPLPPPSLRGCCPALVGLPYLTAVDTHVRTHAYARYYRYFAQYLAPSVPPSDAYLPPACHRPPACHSHTPHLPADTYYRRTGDLALAPTACITRLRPFNAAILLPTITEQRYRACAHSPPFRFTCLSLPPATFYRLLLPCRLYGPTTTPYHPTTVALSG